MEAPHHEQVIRASSTRRFAKRAARVFSGWQLEREAARLREMRDDNMRIKEEADEARRQAAEAVRLERMQRQRLRVRPPVRADANNPTPKPRSPLAGGVPVGRGRKVPLYLRMQAQFQRKARTRSASFAPPFLPPSALCGSVGAGDGLGRESPHAARKVEKRCCHRPELGASERRKGECMHAATVSGIQ
jgi:hypothetical protein